MSDMTNYLESVLINHSLGKSSYTMPATVYLCLFTADPGEAGSMTAEVPSGRGYARQAITTTMSSSSGGSTSSNAGVITFGPCSTTAWGTITHVGVADSATIGAGNLLYKKAMPVSKTIDIADSLQFAAGQLTLSMN